MIAISQPTYLPWSGYFDLIDRSSIFVFLDGNVLERHTLKIISCITLVLKQYSTYGYFGKW